MITFSTSDNGNATDHWPAFPDEYYPSIRVALLKDNKEIGYAVVLPDRKSLANIWIDPGYRGQDKGTILLDEVIERYGINRLCAFPTDPTGKSATELIEWYQSKGFEVTGYNMSRK